MGDYDGGFFGGMEDYGDEGALTGALVKICDYQDEILPLKTLLEFRGDEDEDEDEDGMGEGLDDDVELTPVNPSGMVGQALEYDAQTECYCVYTINKLLFSIPERHVTQYVPPEPEMGGFDIIWPHEFNSQDIYNDILEEMVQILHTKGYCVVQMWMSDQERQAVSDTAMGVSDWHLPMRRFEAAYLGFDNETKFTVVPNVGDPEFNARGWEGMVPYMNNMFNIGQGLHTWQDVFGLSMSNMMNSMLRIPIGPHENRDKLRPAEPSLTEAIETDEAKQSAESQDALERVWQCQFLERRSMMMLMCIDNEGGELTLVPRADFKDEKVDLPLRPNRLFIFNNVLLGHIYKPAGNWHAALQTWLLKESEEPIPDAADDSYTIELPTELMDSQVHIMSTMTNYPGKGEGPQGFWAMASSCTDAQSKVPMGRFDIDMYYTDGGKEEHSETHSYAMHGSFISDAGLLYFDNAKFRISTSEARLMSPGQRSILETGYECLYRADHDPTTLKGLDCGVFLGDSGSIWIDELGEMNGSFTWAGKNQHVSSTRLSHILDMTGPCITVDTACSSSLVAVSLAHNAVRTDDGTEATVITDSQARNALAVGLQLMLAPRWFVLYCGPKMLSPRGRCFTFDSSADGFARGEGCGSIFMSSSQPQRDQKNFEDTLAILAGSAANQDGRSASMTAPHGPSQQQCILTSLKEFELTPNNMSMAECHGTGTALGDPIEVSALRMVMQKRETPILNTSAKTLVGHLEAAAGLCGLIKCVLSAVYSDAAPNAHFQMLNPHLDVNGYPVYFVNETCDFGQQASLSGVSSFGFGGTNARGDIWGRAMLGARKVEKVVGAMQARQQLVKISRLMEGGQLGPQLTDSIMAIGSWDGWKSGHLCDKSGTMGSYSFVVVIGETRREFFVLALNEEIDAVFRPAYCNADYHAETIGPDYNGNLEKTWWMIDAREDNCPVGTVYRVSFTWQFQWDAGEYRSIWWEPYALPSDARAHINVHSHIYSISGSFNSWSAQEMRKSEEEQGLWWMDIRVGLTGEEEFQFSRDADWRQVIYPALERTRKTSVPIRGPDNAGEGKTWVIRGPVGEIVSIQLRILEGEITVTTSSLTKGVKVWQSIEDSQWSEYFIVGTFNKWTFSTMQVDTDNRMFYRYVVKLGPSGDEEFQIVHEKDWKKRIYPSKRQAAPGEALCQGPDDYGEDDMTWMISGQPGQQFEVCLDLEQTDMNWVVWWTEAEPAGIADEEADAGEAQMLAGIAEGEAREREESGFGSEDETGEVFAPAKKAEGEGEGDGFNSEDETGEVFEPGES